jgi:hypothetical protein
VDDTFAEVHRAGDAAAGPMTDDFHNATTGANSALPTQGMRIRSRMGGSSWERRPMNRG